MITFTGTSDRSFSMIWSAPASAAWYKAWTCISALFGVCYKDCKSSLWYMAWACSWAYSHFSFLVCLCTHRLVHGLGLQLGLFTFLMFLFVCACTAYRPWYMAWTCSSTDLLFVVLRTRPGPFCFFDTYLASA